MFKEKFLEFLNIRKIGFWIQTSQEKEAMISIINILNTNNVDRIFIWNRITSLEEIIVEENNYKKKSLKTTSPEIANLPIHLIYKNVLCETNDYIQEDDICALILNDYDLYLENPDYIRSLREIFEINYKKYVPVIILSENFNPPQKLQHIFSLIKYENPTIEEINQLLTSYESNRNVEINNKDIINQKLLGFNRTEIIELLDLSFYKYNCVNLNILNDNKIELINKTNVINYKIPKVKLEDIGGNNNFKRWYEEIKICMDKDSEKYGVEKPKGYLALGVPGNMKQE